MGGPLGPKPRLDLGSLLGRCPLPSEAALPLLEGDCGLGGQKAPLDFIVPPGLLSPGFWFAFTFQLSFLQQLSAFSLAGPSLTQLLFDPDLITLGLVTELIQPSYVKGLILITCASSVLSILHPQELPDLPILRSRPQGT